VTFEREGERDRKPGKPPQDIEFIVREVSHAIFQKEKDNLICEKVI
jgi:DnaJ-class molecular chaperone